MPLSDKEIRKRCVPCAENGFAIPDPPMIEPFAESVKQPGVISYGLTHAGYDLRLSGAEVWVFNASYGEVIDPKRMADPAYLERVFTKRTCLAGEPIVVPANGYVLGRAYETLRMPRDMVGVCIGKSTLARCGVIVNITPVEPGWEGVLTLEIANSGGLPLKVYAMEGICQIQFHFIEGVVEVDYAEKRGVYFGQVGVTAARVRE